MNIGDLYELIRLLEINQNSKKKRLYGKLSKDIDNLVSKYEYLYHKYIIKNKQINTLNDNKEKEIAIVQNSINVFFPYILAYNVAQL